MRRRSVILLCAAGLAIGGVAAAWAAFSSSTSTPSHDFSAAASFCTGNALNPFWLTGFELGVSSATAADIYDIGLGATVDSAVKRSGSYSLRLDATGSGAYAAQAVSNATVTMRFALRLASLPASDVSLAGAILSAGSSVALGYRASDQKLTLRWGTGTTQESADTVSAGTWYVIDLRVAAGSNPHTADWRIDGVSQPSASINETGALISYIGPGSNVPGETYTAHYDDIIATTTSGDYPIGTGSVLALRPDGVGTHNNSGNFREEDNTAIDANTWMRLDDVPMNSTAQSVRQTSSSGTSYLSFTFSNPTTTCIKAVRATVAYTSASTTSNNGKTSIFVGTTERVVYSGDMSETTLTYRVANVAPTASAWTQAAVNGLTARVGYATDVNPVADWEALQLSYEAQ